MFKERDPLALAQELANGASNDLDKELALADGKAPETAPEKVASDNNREPLKITPASKKQEAPTIESVPKDKPGTNKESAIDSTEVVEEKPFTLEQIREAEEAVEKIMEGKMELGEVREELRSVVGERVADERKAWREKQDAKFGKDPIIRERGEKIDDSPIDKPELIGEEPIITEKGYGYEIDDLKIEKPSSAEKKEKPEEKKEASEVSKLLDKAREDYVAAMLVKEKAEKGENKLTGIRARIKEFFVSGMTSYEGDKTRLPAKNEKISGAQAEAEEARAKLKLADQALRGALKNYRNEETGNIDKKAEELKAVGKSEEEIKQIIDKDAQAVLLATTMREGAKMDSLRTDKQIEQMGTARKYVNEKAEQFVDWYKNQPMKTKVAVSVGLGLGGAAGALMGLTTVVSLTLAGQIGLRVLGSAMTTGGLSKAMESSREKLADKKISKEFAGKYLETLKKQDDELNDKIFERLEARKNEKVGRFILAGTMGALVGSGALAQGVRNGFNSEFGQSMTGKLRSMADGAIDWVKKPFVGDAKMPLPGGATHPEAIVPPTGAKAVEAVQNLPIGTRGPEGAIIDNFKAKPELAKAFGWDGKTDIKQWAGTRAHQLWSDSIKGELAKPGVAEKLTAQGFTPDAEGYAKAMHKIGKGAVELDPKGRIHLTDNTSFFKNVTQSVEAQPKVKIIEPYTIETSVAPAAPEVPVVETPAAGAPIAPKVSTLEVPTADPLLGADGPKLKEALKNIVDPEILKDATFKAGAKESLGKILEAVPERAYKGDSALTNYWHSDDIKTLSNLNGTGLFGLWGSDVNYDDFRKYSEIARFLRENAGAGAAERLKDMTVEDFLKTYGSDLGKGVKGQVGGNLSSVIENTPSAKINILSEQAPGVKVNLSETEAALVKDFNEGHFVGEGGSQNIVESLAPEKVGGHLEVTASTPSVGGTEGIVHGVEEVQNTATLGRPVIGGNVSEEVRKTLGDNIKNNPLITVTRKSLEQIQALDSSGRETLITQMKNKLQELVSNKPSTVQQSVMLKNNISEIKTAITSLENYNNLINKK